MGIKQLALSTLDKGMTLLGGKHEYKSTINVFDLIRTRLQGIIKSKYNISAQQCIEYFCSVNAAGKSISLLSEEFASVKPYLYDIKNEKYIADHAVLDFFSTPNPDKSRHELFKAISAYYLITGNSYLLALGGVNMPPIEVDVVDPSCVSPKESRIDNYAASYIVDMANGYQKQLEFGRVEQGKRFRYVEGIGRELYHIKNFNPGSDRLRGMSQLDMAFYEVEQSLKSSIHNLSILNKGARMSGALSSETALGDDVRPRIREELSREYSGSENAGKILLLDGGKFNWHEMSSTLKDMDFRFLKRDVEFGIYNMFNIPLPLVSPDHMTMDNYGEARVALYDNGVIPLLNRIYEELSILCLPRFKLDPNKFKLWYDVGEIPALEPRRNAEIQRKRESGVLTINEIRDLLGYDMIEGGDILYQPMTMVPVGTDTNLLKIPRGQASKAKFISIMNKQLDAEGNRKYTDVELEQIANKIGLK